MPHYHGKRLGGLLRFGRDFVPKSRVLIIGTGPSAWNIRKLDPSEFTTVTVHKSWPLVEADVFLASDPHLWRLPWYGDIAAKHHVVPRELAAHAGYPADYYDFDWLAGNNEEPLLSPFELDCPSGATGRAIQLIASFPQVKEIHLVGVDACNFELHYYDFTENPNIPIQKPFGKQTKFLRKLCEAAETKGIKLVHHGATALEGFGVTVADTNCKMVYTPAYHPNLIDLQGKPKAPDLRPTNPQTILPDNDFHRSFLNGGMPKVVHVLAPGPQGAAHWGKIPNHAFVIACNGAGLIKRPGMGWDWDLQIVADVRAKDKAWWDGVTKTSSIKLAPYREGEFEPHNLFDGFADYVFRQENVDELKSNVFTGSYTVAAKACIAAYRGGAREIILCGVDQFGDGYYDGTSNSDVPKDGVWPHVARFNHVIRLLQEQGVTVESISPTALRVARTEGQKTLLPRKPLKIIACFEDKPCLLWQAFLMWYSFMRYVKRDGVTFQLYCSIRDRPSPKLTELIEKGMPVRLYESQNFPHASAEKRPSPLLKFYPPSIDSHDCDIALMDTDVVLLPAFVRLFAFEGADFIAEPNRMHFDYYDYYFKWAESNGITLPHDLVPTPGMAVKQKHAKALIDECIRQIWELTDSTGDRRDGYSIYFPHVAAKRLGLLRRETRQFAQTGSVGRPMFVNRFADIFDFPDLHYWGFDTVFNKRDFAPANQVPQAERLTDKHYGEYRGIATPFDVDPIPLPPNPHDGAPYRITYLLWKLVGESRWLWRA